MESIQGHFLWRSFFPLNDRVLDEGPLFVVFFWGPKLPHATIFSCLFLWKKTKVQGMTHIAAVLLYVFSLAVTSNFLDAEADTWL